ncbi:MAG TPA: hypothetical protein VM099_15440 [Gemmatimonadaceae bacterium]|nr:hypothetical protein [Gemmatimonadaceae bacterium]
MATTVSTFASPTTESRVRSRALSIEWPIYAVVSASTLIVVGLLWDISWHRTIGRDTFWSPPHLLEQIAAVIAGLSCGYLALHTTFAGSNEARANSVRFWRFFQAPLGAWVCIWGTIMMITSAPFDNWWHNAYGLDVKIISPPHMVLAAGMIGIELGAMLMVLGAQNRAVAEADRKRLGAIFAYASGIVIVMATVLIEEYAAFGNEMHGSSFYQLTGALVPIFLVAFARASRLKWPATTTAILYMVFVLINMWITQLFPAQARLAPIYNPVTHMVPTPFPLLLVFPAIGIDLLMKKFGAERDWTLSLAIGVAFTIVMLAVHWFWGDFLLSPYARNPVFAADQWDYTSRLGRWRYQWWNLDVDSTGKFSVLLLAQGIGIAAIYATISSRLGLWWGAGMARIKR